MRERRERGEIVSGVTRIGPEVDFVESRWTGGAFEDVDDGVAGGRTLWTEIVVGAFDEELVRL